MPAPDVILNAARAIANDWRSVAIGWHAALALMVLGFLGGWRPSRRVLAGLLVLPLLSVSALAFATGNPFNGGAFALLSIALAAIGMRLPRSAIEIASPAALVPGILLVAFGWIYPHFLQSDNWLTYAYAAPFGLIPCPTLAGVAGVTLIVGGLRSPAWQKVLCAAVLIYGAIGVFRLGVTLDYGLLIGGAALIVATLRPPMRYRSVRALKNERARPLPGDELIGSALGTMTHAIDIERGPADVWPWIAQMGAGNRGGWYSYDVLDNGWHPSATRIVPELQDLSVGMLFPALPGETGGFEVIAFEPERHLLLGWRDAAKGMLVTWAFVLDAVGDGRTRLIARARGGQQYQFHGLPSHVGIPMARLVHFIMQRKQLIGIADRVERGQEGSKSPGVQGSEGPGGQGAKGPGLRGFKGRSKVGGVAA